MSLLLAHGPDNAWWTWIVKHINVDTVSVAAAILSLIVAVFSIVIARRATKAAERSARAAEDQAEGVRQQVNEAVIAGDAAKKSYEWSRLLLLESARNRTESQSPKPIVAIEIKTPPKMLRDPEDHYGRDRVEIPEIPAELDFWKNRWDIIEFIVRGVLINDGADAMRVIPSGPKFISGRSALATAFVDIPLVIHPNYGMYLLESKSRAIFEWHAGCTVDNWIDISNRADGAIPVDASLICFPGSSDRGVTTVTFEIGSKVVYPILDKKDKWRVRLTQPIIYVNIERDFLRDTNNLRQELTGEFWDGVNFWPKK
jgi:hypothetical protein